MFAGCFAPQTQESIEVAPAPVARAVRTSLVPAVPPQEAIAALKEGNGRYISGTSQVVREALADQRKQFVANGQKPMAAVFGCADSRAPIDTIFDAYPGDLFILRNAGNTTSRAEGSMVGSLEYAISALDTKLILVLGHTKCGAVAGATKTMLAQNDPNAPPKLEKGQSPLEILLAGLVPVAKKAKAQLADGATEEQVINKAIQVNVFNTMSGLFSYSSKVREMVTSGEVQVQGGIYDLETGKVEFLGQHPEQAALLASHLEVTECHACAHDGLSQTAVGA